jgi:hypothetical protein
MYYLPSAPVIDALVSFKVYGDFEDLETGEKRSGEQGKGAEEEEEEAPRIVDYGGDAAREKGGK